MKRFMSLMLVAMLIVTCFATVAFAAGSASVSVGVAETQPNNTVTIPITVSSDSGFACFQMHVSVAAPLTITAINGAVGNPATGAVSYITSDGKNTNSASFTVTISVPAGVSVGSYPVSVSVDYVTDADLVALPVGSSTGAVKIPCPDHKWGEWKVTKEATCAAEGEETRTCTVAGCGETETRAIAKKAHTFGAWTETKAPTCTEEGVETRTCSVCGEAETRAIAAKGHSFGAWVTTKEATCTAEGEQKRTCSVCNVSETKVLPMVDHAWSKDWEKDDHNHWHKCEVCGAKDTAEKHGFGMWEVGKVPTEEEPGWSYKTCLTCGHVEYKTVEFDAPPPTGDLTPVITFGVISMLAAVAYVSKRKFAK